LTLLSAFKTAETTQRKTPSKTFLRARHSLSTQPYGRKVLRAQRDLRCDDFASDRVSKIECSNFPMTPYGSCRYLMTTQLRRCIQHSSLVFSVFWINTTRERNIYWMMTCISRSYLFSISRWIRI
jgi:hypothetical protein